MKIGRIQGSYRALLTRRFVWLWAIGIVVISLVTHFAVRAILLQQVDRTLSLVASLQASVVVESAPDNMELREWQLRPEEVEQLQDVLWFIQVYDETHRVVTSSSNLTEPLPDPGIGWNAFEMGEIFVQTVSSDLGPLRQMFYPLQRLDPAHAHHAILVAVSLSPVYRTLGQIDIVLMGIGLLGLLAAMVVGWNVATRAIGPVGEIVDQASAIHSPGERKRITAYARTEEFASLVEVINKMLERLEIAFESQQRFTADASHELRTPLTALRGTMEVALRRERPVEEYSQVLESSLDEVARMQRLVEDLLILARSDAHVLQPRREAVQTTDLVAELVSQLAPVATELDVSIDASDVRALTLQVDRDMTRRTLLNLVSNAIRHSPAGGVVSIGCEMAGGDIVLSVRDQGDGVPDFIRPHLFDRFYKADIARSTGEGAGLGLSLVKAMVEVHSGRITLEDSSEKGAVFVVHLPADLNLYG